MYRLYIVWLQDNAGQIKLTYNYHKQDFFVPLSYDNGPTISGGNLSLVQSTQSWLGNKLLTQINLCFRSLFFPFKTLRCSVISRKFCIKLRHSNTYTTEVDWGKNRPGLFTEVREKATNNYQGSFLFVRTDRPERSRRNNNFTSARSVKSQTVCRKEMFFQQKPLEKVDFIC